MALPLNIDTTCRLADTSSFTTTESGGSAEGWIIYQAEASQ